MNKFQAWLTGLACTAAAVTASYLWIDRPAAYFAHDHLAQVAIFREVTHVPGILFACAAVVFVVFGIGALLRANFQRWQVVLFLSGLSLVVAETVKEQLKFVFGRTWPDTWINNNPSLIHDGAFGFNPFHSGVGYTSFPSGHTTAICAVMSVLWICYPKFRALYALAILAVAAALIGANYHFVSDVIAGGFLGISTGWISTILWQARGLPGVQPFGVSTN